VKWGDFLERYGVTLGVIAALAIVLAILPSSKPTSSAGNVTSGGADITDVTGNSTGGTSGPSGSNGAGGSNNTLGGGGSGGGGGGGVRIPYGVGGPNAKPGVIFGKGACRPDGREVGISRYDPPCATWIGGNGGSTWRGVTPTTVRIVRWIGQVDQATKAVLQTYRLADSESVRSRSYQAMFTYSNQHLMTYGRKVQMINYNSSGAATDDTAMKADAIKIANDYHAFGVIVGTPEAQIPDVLARELARNHVVCICTVSPTDKFYKDLPPYIFGPGLPPGTLYAEHIAEYIGKRLKGRKATHGGDPNKVTGITTQTRKFGLVWINGVNGRVDPEAQNVKNEIVQYLKNQGITLAATPGYNDQSGQNQDEMSNVIAQLRNAHVTTVIMWVDPLSPIFITRDATQQGYFPEWFITGSGLSDTTAAGRLYDQQQWTHAFGISPLSVLWQNVKLSGGYRAAHHGDPSMPDGQEGVLVNVYAAYVANMFLGIHMAGPILTPDAFAQGMYKYPKTGGTAAYPLVHFTRSEPSAVKDFTEIWYSGTQRGYDERSDNSQPGMMMHVATGKRYELGHWPATDPDVFDPAHAITNTDNPPGGFDPPHEQDGHKHKGDCLSCPGFRTYK
jgi:hypothetical protein